MSSNESDGLVLVVDDQASNLGLVKTALSRDGFEVETATDAATALRWLSERTPDLILLDVMMPEMNGFELCGRIKKNAATHDIPVIFLSGDDHQGSIRNGFKVGGVDYVTKPFNKEELLARVRTHVELRRAHQRHAAQLMERNQVLKLIANEWHKPLQRIVLTTSKMKMLCGKLDDVTASVLATEATSAERMLASIEAFLQLRAVDGDENGDGEAREEAFTSDDLSRMMGRWYATAKRKPLEIVLKDTARGVPLEGSSFMARQIVDAALQNAINYTPMNGRVKVSISRDGGRAVMTVTDTGPGFPESYLEQTFHPYLNRGIATANEKKAKPTLGIGLAAAKRAADRLGATLSLDNGAEEGAVVKIGFAIAKKGRG
ncbi:response regulator [Phragmitibacter flavus]|uniref:Response regulator n=1 Tax=Phragmitibacter flavus TaxID=2576071 RepID=A0A5R8KJ00_9BACT|nr:response regulator [Phragmitibacter flavus]TLD72227.1 response regulator [Phragmitibacter flavus]